MASEQDIIRMYNPPEDCHNERSTDIMDFIYCVAIPSVAVLILLILLAVIMCCNSKACKCNKYSALNTQTSDIQMENYNSIRRASANLRLMSQNRETPVMGSRTNSMTLDRSQRRTPRTVRDSCSSAPGTLQRHQRNRPHAQNTSGSPPPYNIDQNESFHSMIEHQRRTRPANVDLHIPPPAPGYRTHSDDDFLRHEFMQSDMKASVRYDDSPDQNGSGVQPLLYNRSYNG